MLTVAIERPGVRPLQHLIKKPVIKSGRGASVTAHGTDVGYKTLSFTAHCLKVKDWSVTAQILQMHLRLRDWNPGASSTRDSECLERLKHQVQAE